MPLTPEQQMLSNFQAAINDIGRDLNRFMQNQGGSFNDATMTFGRSIRGLINSNDQSIEESIRVRRASDREVQTMLEMSKALKAVPGKLMSSMSMFGELLADQTQNVLGKLNTGVIFDDVDRYMNIVRKKMGSATITLDNVAKVYAKSTKEAAKQIEAILGALDNRSQEYQDTAKALGIDTEQVGEQFENLEKIVLENQKAIAQSNIQINAELKARKMLTAGLAFIGTAAFESAKAAAKFGTNLETATELQYGVNAAELAQIQTQAKQARLAAGVANDDFISSLRDSALNLSLFSGDMTQGMKFYADSLNMFRSVQKGSATEATDFYNKQAALAKEMNTVYGVTFEEFQQFNQSLLQDNEMQEALLKIDKKKRAAYILEINALNAHMLSLGLSKEAAQEATKAMVALGNMKPMDRFKAAFKAQQAAAFYGMGSEKGAELTKLIMKGIYVNPEEQRRRTALSAELNEKMGAAVEKFAGTDWQIAAEVQRQTMMEGLDEVLGVGKGAALSEGKKLDENAKAQAKAESQRENLNAVQKEAAQRLFQIQSAAAHSGITLTGILDTAKEILATIVTLGAGGMILGRKGPKVPGGGGGRVTTGTGGAAGGAAGGKWGKALSVLGKAGSLLKGAGPAAAVLGAGEQAYEGYKHYKETGKKGEAVGQAAGGAAGGWAGFAAGAAAGGAIGTAGFPLVGTAVGLLAGGLLGYFGADAAGAVGKSIGGMFDDDIDPQVKKTKEMIEMNNKLLDQAIQQDDKASIEMYQKRAEELKRLEKSGEKAAEANKKAIELTKEMGEEMRKIFEKGSSATEEEKKKLAQFGDELKKLGKTNEEVSKAFQEGSATTFSTELKKTGAESLNIYEKTTKVLERNGELMTKLSAEGKTNIVDAYKIQNEALQRLENAYKNATTDATKESIGKIVDQQTQALDTARLKIVSAENSSAIFRKQIEQNEARLAQLGPEQEAARAQLTAAIQTLNEGLAKLAETSEQGNKELQKIRDHTKTTVETLEKNQDTLDEQKAKELAEQRNATKAREMEVAAATRQAGACP